MNSHKYQGEVLVCEKEYFEAQREDVAEMLEDCLLYVMEPITYDVRVTLCCVYYLSLGDVFHVAPRAKIVWPHGPATFMDRPDKYSGTPARIASLGAEFLTSLCSRDAYRNLSGLARVRMKSMLLEANDSAALYAHKYSGKLHRQLQRLEIRELLLADDEAVYSYLSLHLADEENRAKTRKIMAIDAELEVAQDVVLPVSFNFNGGSVLSTLTNVVIGANGVGKTRLLKALVTAAHHNKLDVENDFDDENVSSHIPVVVFTHEKQQWQPLAKQFNECVSLGSGKKEWSLLGKALQQLHLRDESGYLVQMAMNLLAQFIDLHQLFFKVSGRGSFRRFSELIHNPGLFRDLDVSQQAVYRDALGSVHTLSSGQRVLICFIINIVRYCTPRTLVIIDEPENHLHPQFISLIMRALNAALQATESVAVVVTHSPFVVREIEREGVLVLEERNSQLVLLRPSLQTLGGDVSLIADYVFGDLHIRKGYQLAIDEVLGPQRTEDERRAAMDELASLGNDAASYVRGRFMEWTRG
jgi:ABC-type cobalamin/Fe3+-siderophores transport system ATPase subunit